MRADALSTFLTSLYFWQNLVRIGLEDLLRELGVAVLACSPSFLVYSAYVSVSICVATRDG